MIMQFNELFLKSINEINEKRLYLKTVLNKTMFN